MNALLNQLIAWTLSLKAFDIIKIYNELSFAPRRFSIIYSAHNDFQSLFQHVRT